MIYLFSLICWDTSFSALQPLNAEVLPGLILGPLFFHSPSDLVQNPGLMSFPHILLTTFIQATTISLPGHCNHSNQNSLFLLPTQKQCDPFKTLSQIVTLLHSKVSSGFPQNKGLPLTSSLVFIGITTFQPKCLRVFALKFYFNIFTPQISYFCFLHFLGFCSNINSSVQPSFYK